MFRLLISLTLLYDFKDKDQNETILEGAITPILDLQPELPQSIADVISRGLSYQPENRYENAQEMLEALKAAL